MRTFHYKGYDAAGQPKKGLIEADSIKAVRETLAESGILAEKISASSRAPAFAVGARATVYRELAALLHAGLPLVAALDVLIDSPELSDTRILIASVRDKIKEGTSLAVAIRSAAKQVSEFEEAILETAQQSATMGPMLDRLADFLEEQQALRERLHSALIYPSVVFGVGVCVAAAMLGVLLPRTQAFLADSGAQLPWVTRAVLWVGGAAVSWGLIVFLLLAGAAVAFWVRMMRDEPLRERWDQFLFSLPGVGNGYRLLVGLRFSRTLAVLLRAGVPVIDGLRLAGRATGSILVRNLTAKEVESVRHGDRLSTAVARIPPLASSLPGWLRIGEESGGIVDMLERFGRRYHARWEQFVARGLSLLEPVLIVAIGGFVLVVTLAVLLPILTMTSTVSL